MKRTTNQELKEIFKHLEDAGMNPQFCDTPIPCLDASVQAGIPTDPGYVGIDGVMWMPESMVGKGTLCVITVRGESMINAGFEPGDRVVVEYDVAIRDGDVVVAMIDGQGTLKAYMTDERGNKWLVPHNDNFDAILLTDDMQIDSIGKVVQHIKQNPRPNYSEGQKTIARTLKKIEEPRILTREDIGQAIRNVADIVDEKRKWYAVFRVLVDRELLAEDDYHTFVQWVAEEVPEHPHMPDALDLPRVALYSFSKPVSEWKLGKAPVSGKRFRDYCRIAKCVADEL